MTRVAAGQYSESLSSCTYHPAICSESGFDGAATLAQSPFSSVEPPGENHSLGSVTVHRSDAACGHGLHRLATAGGTSEDRTRDLTVLMSRSLSTYHPAQAAERYVHKDLRNTAIQDQMTKPGLGFARRDRRPSLTAGPDAPAEAGRRL